MKPTRKTKDFSIESILADKRVQNDKKYEIGVHKKCGVVLTEVRHATNSEKHFKQECAKNDRALNETEEKYETSSGELSNLDIKNFECENENKLKIHSDTIVADSESDLTSKIKERSGTRDENILESFERETFKLKNKSATEIIGRVEEKYAINSKKFEPAEFDKTCDEKHGNNYCKPIKSSKRDQHVKLNEKRKQQAEQAPSDQLSDSSIEYLNKNCDDFTENRCKSLMDDLDSDLQTRKSQYSSFKDENNKTKFVRSKTETPEVLRDVEKLEWIQCTRYKPPKIPRKPTIGKNKRKPSFYPRIPFSMFQLDFLEQKFQSSAYLTRTDVMVISDILQLPPNRIKIWFQNRRARDRREFCTNV